MEHLTTAQIAELRDTLEQVDTREARRALLELKRGCYGVCHTCGDAIRFDTLSERPTRGLCLVCTKSLADRRRAQRLGVCGVKPTP